MQSFLHAALGGKTNCVLQVAQIFILHSRCCKQITPIQYLSPFSSSLVELKGYIVYLQLYSEKRINIPATVFLVLCAN